MKKIIGLFIMVFLFFNAFGQTTEEEYNYLTKGYKIQKESGLDMKKGYNLQLFKFYKPNGIPSGWEFSGLFHDGEKVPCAILAVFKKINFDNELEYEKYFCIPSPSSDEMMMVRTQQEIYSHSLNEDVFAVTFFDCYIKFLSDLTMK